MAVPVTAQRFTLDPGLKPYATERQWELLTAWEQHGSKRLAGEALGINEKNFPQALNRIRSNAAKRGYSPEHGYTHTVPDGFQVKGVSSYYDGAGELRGQWVKSQADKERQLEIMQEAVTALCETIKPAKPVKPPASTEDDLMACYPVGDHHIGMYAWQDEAGADYDVETAEHLLCGAMDYLVGSAPNCSRAALVFLGDLLHYDSMEPLTPTNKNLLDSDGRFPKIVRTTIRCVRYAITAALKRHKELLVIVEPGNHDLSTSIFLMEAIAALYENEPRVKVDTSPAHFHYFNFGRNLVGTHHGHGVKRIEQLPMIMATDQPELWGQTAYRFWWLGHLHHRHGTTFGSKDFQGCSVEGFRVLPPNDAHHSNKGYRPMRDMKSIVLHREHGEFSRHTVNPGMLLDG